MNLARLQCLHSVRIGLRPNWEITSGRQWTPSEAQLDKERREEREEWSVPRQQDGAFDRALTRFSRHSRIDGRYSDRQRSARELCERGRNERQGAGIPIAAAAHRRRLGRLGFVTRVLGCGLTRHVSRTRDLIAVKGADRQRQRRRAQEHGDNPAAPSTTEDVQTGTCAPLPSRDRAVRVVPTNTRTFANVVAGRRSKCWILGRRRGISRTAQIRSDSPGHLLGRSCFEASRWRLRFQATRAKTTSRRTPLIIVTVCALIQPPADVRLRGGG